MTGGLISCALILALVLVDLFARQIERSAIGDSAVSGDFSTDYHIPTGTKRLGLLANLAGIAAIASGVMLGFPMVAGAVVAICAALVRLQLAFTTRAAATASCGLRLRLALSRAPITSAKLVFYFSAVDLARPDHVTAWESALNATGLPWFVILRERHHLEAFRTPNRPAAIFAKSLTELASCIPTTTRAVVYANNAQKNRKMLAAFPELSHVQLLHGDSDKPPSYSSLTKNYTHVFVAGQMAIDRYARHGVTIPKDRFCIVGRPQVQALKHAMPSADTARKQVLYMPTWRGFFEDTQLSSLDRAAQVISAILALPKVDLTFKPHPLSYKDPHWPKIERAIRLALSQGGGRYCETTTPVFDLYNAADILITDISSVMIDFLFTGKPFLTILPQGFDTARAAEYPSLDAAYQVSPELANLAAQASRALGDDPMKARRAQVQAYAFGDIGQPPGAAFNAACYALFEDKPAMPVVALKQKANR